MRFLLTASKLENADKARRTNVEIVSYGAYTTSSTHQVIMSLKIIDVLAIDPLTNKIISLQTRNGCWTT